MVPTANSAQNSSDQSLNNSGTSSGATNTMLQPKKVQGNEISLAVPAIAIEVASETAIAVESSESERSSIHSSSSEQRALAKKRRELARTVREAVAASLALLEATSRAPRAA